MTEETAGSAPLERRVRPRVWMVRRHDAPDYWIPFLHEPVDALKDPEREVVRLHWPEDLAAERERCISIVRKYGPSDFNDLGQIIIEIRAA